MRGTSTVFLALVVACTTTQELAPTTESVQPPFPSVTSTTAMETTTTTGTGTTSPSTSTTTTTLPKLNSLAYEEVARLSFPVQMTAVPGGRLAYVATRDGHIWAYDGSEVLSDPVLDISGRVRSGGEQGLLSIVLHPDDPSRLFAHYSANDGDTVVSEFTLLSDTTAGPDTERVLLRLDQPARNHNGGMLQFHPDGSLLVGLGDGGGANDRFDNGQNQGTLLGGLVSLQVDGQPQPTLHAYGLRNPWRFWIDGETIYIADVGQSSFEEVSVAALQPGFNFGWPITEGLHCFRPPSGCDTAGQTLPVVEVRHGDAGTCSITGGIVYRGDVIPEIEGMYFYSDYCGGYLRSFRIVDGVLADEADWTDQVGVAGRVTSFGLDGAGEMYVTTSERLLKVVPVRG